MVDGGEDDEEDGSNGAANHAEHQQGRGQELRGQEDGGEASNTHPCRVEGVGDGCHVGGKLKRPAHPKRHCHGLEHPDDCSGQGKEDDDQKKENPLLDVTQFGRSVVLALGVGVLVIELRHRDAAGRTGEDEEANGDENAPAAGDDERPGDRLDSINQRDHFHFRFGNICSVPRPSLCKSL